MTLFSTDVTWTTLMMSLFPFWTRTVYRTYIFNGGTEKTRAESKISWIVSRRWTELLWAWNDMRVIFIFGWANPLTHTVRRAMHLFNSRSDALGLHVIAFFPGCFFFWVLYHGRSRKTSEERLLCHCLSKLNRFNSIVLNFLFKSREPLSN